MPNNLPTPDIRRINTLNTICLDVNGAFRNAHTYQAIWEQLKHYKEKHLLKPTNTHFISISQDNPQITSPDLRRLYIGFIADECALPEGKFTRQEIAGGMYAVFTHQGSYARLPDLYKTIHEQWLPHSRYIQKHPLSFEVYLNTPDEVAEEELVTEIYIPIDKC